MSKLKRIAVAMVAASCVMGAAQGWADDGIPLFSDGWQVKNKLDEEFRVRDDVGISKDRTLGQSDLDKTVDGHSSFIEKLHFHFTMRASYDAVYDENSSHFGTSAGGSITTQNGTAWGSGTVFGNGTFSTSANPNTGLRQVYGGNYDGGIQLFTPVRPCDVDHRGCIPGYMDFSKNELAAPEFNEHLDFLREAYVDADIPVGDNTLAFRIGRQQLVWGRTDLFRVLDVVNPVDYSRNNIYDDLQDIRIPMGMVRADYRMGAKGPFDDLNFQGIVVVEPWRANNLGQAGSTNEPLQAADFFRALKTCWDNGCSVGNFAPSLGLNTVNFGPGHIGISRVDLPDYTVSNMPVGGKVEGEYKGVGFSVNALTYRSQMPSLHGAQDGSSHSFDFAMEFPRINLVGGSVDFNIEQIDTAVRMESVYTHGEEFADSNAFALFKKSDVVRYVVGADRSTFIPFLNPNRAFLISTQIFGQHLINYDMATSSSGYQAGIPDFQDDWTQTLLIKGWFNADTLSPQVVFARDYLARSNVIEPSVEWQPSNTWRFRLGGNIKFGEFLQSFDTGVTGVALGNTGGIWGASPLGIFKSGILGMASKETEIFGNATLRF